MTGRRYYLMTFSSWRSHAAHCAETHFVDLNAPQEQGSATNDGTLVFALITADEAAHIALENDAETEPLPHPLARTPISERVAGALAPFGIAAGDDTLTVAEKLAHVNPLLRHRVF
jgi:hypothetical protein